MIESLHQEFYKDEWIPVILPHDRDVPLATLQLWTFPPMNWSVETGPFDCAPRFLECVVNVSIRLIYRDCIWNCVGLIWYIQVISAVVLLPAPNMATLLRVYPRPRHQHLGISPSSSRRCHFQKVPRPLDLATTLRNKSPERFTQWWKSMTLVLFQVFGCSLWFDIKFVAVSFCMTGGSNHQKQKDWPRCWFGKSCILAVTVIWHDQCFGITE